MSGSIYSDGSYLESNPGWHAEDSPWKAQQVLRMLKQHDIHPAAPLPRSAAAPARFFDSCRCSLPEAEVFRV